MKTKNPSALNLLL